MTRSWKLPALFLAFIVFYLLPLPLHGLWIPDESRYAQISQEMLQTGDWAAPYFMGLRYFEKPAAGYWMIAFGQALFGQNLFGVRIASALSLGLSVLLAYVIAGRLWRDPRKSFVCAVIYMSFGLIAGQAGYANLDPQFTFWVNLSLVALWFAIDSSTRPARLRGWLVVGLACGMGFMTKGFLALLFPVLIGVPYMVRYRRLYELIGYGLVAIGAALIISLPWVLTVHCAEPDFWRFFFWHEHIRRFAGDDAQHAQPWWFYLPVLAIASLPWALFVPATFKLAWQTRSAPPTFFLLLWLLFPLALFSSSNGKLPTYIMPCLLPLALLIGQTLHRAIDQRNTRMVRINGVVNFVLGGLALLALAFVQVKQPVYRHEPLTLALLIVAIGAWLVTNGLAVMRPLTLWLAPALGMGALIALLPVALPEQVVNNKTPDGFIAEHLTQLRKTQSLLSNDLGTASALAWHTKNPQVALYNTVGETKYGIAYPDAAGRQVDLGDVQQWMINARQRGSVGVVMRVNNDDELHEIELLPKDGMRYERGNTMILIFEKTPS
jgi:4-amino-4-deoxy-L-arabinose transferase